MKRKLTIIHMLCERWLLSMLTMFLMSVGMRAENYGFTRATKGSIPAHRAYLVLAAEAEAEGRLSIFEDETTALKLVNSEERIVNSEVYDLQGRKVNHSSLFTSGKVTLKKGLYILNGKKQVIK